MAAVPRPLLDTKAELWLSLAEPLRRSQFKCSLGPLHLLHEPSQVLSKHLQEQAFPLVLQGHNLIRSSAGDLEPAG